MLKRLLLLAVLTMACWTVTVCTVAFATDEGTEASSLDSCVEIKTVAVEIMPDWAYQRLSDMSETECVDLLGGYTAADLETTLREAMYIEDTSAPRDNQVTFSPDYRDRRVRKVMTPSVDYRHLDGTTIHPDIAGWSITKHNQNDSFMMMHRNCSATPVSGGLTS